MKMWLKWFGLWFGLSALLFVVSLFLFPGWDSGYRSDSCGAAAFVMTLRAFPLYGMGRKSSHKDP